MGRFLKLANAYYLSGRCCSAKQPPLTANPSLCDSHHIWPFPVLTTCILREGKPLSLPFSGPNMTLLAKGHTRVNRPVPLLEWHRWFAWYPVPTVINGKLHYAWLHSQAEMGNQQIQRHN
jgi:hypothetical protein